jgi:hypothetical protein
MRKPNVFRLRRGGPPLTARNRRGAVLVEVIVGMTVMVIGLTGVAGMTVAAGKRAGGLTGAGGRTAVQTHVVDQLMVLPYAQLPAQAGCASILTMPFPHRRCVSVSDVASDRRQITVVFTPSNRTLRPDTVVFERANAVPPSPFR